MRTATGEGRLKHDLTLLAPPTPRVLPITIIPHLDTTGNLSVASVTTFVPALVLKKMNRPNLCLLLGNVAAVTVL